jgi:hypothetical protein
LLFFTSRLWRTYSGSRAYSPREFVITEFDCKSLKTMILKTVLYYLYGPLLGRGKKQSAGKLRRFSLPTCEFFQESVENKLKIFYLSRPEVVI